MPRSCLIALNVAGVPATAGTSWCYSNNSAQRGKRSLAMRSVTDRRGCSLRSRSDTPDRAKPRIFRELSPILRAWPCHQCEDQCARAGEQVLPAKLSPTRKAYTAYPRSRPALTTSRWKPPDSRSIHQSGILLEVDQRARLDFTLTVGSTSETITVEGSAPLLNTFDASVSTVIGNRFVENMPLERPQLQLADRTRAGSGVNAGQYLRTGPVQRQWPASGRKLLHGGWGQRQPRQRRKRRPVLSGRRRPASLDERLRRRRATSSRSMPWKNSAFRRPRLRRSMAALRARRYRS